MLCYCELRAGGVSRRLIQMVPQSGGLFPFLWHRIKGEDL